jgi:hypothetical protein
VSYALDLDTEVEKVEKSQPDELVSVRLAKGTLISTRRLRQEATYNLRNRGTKARKVLVEHPFRADWQLMEPAKPAERARDVYRFEVAVEPAKGAKLLVAEERQLEESVMLASMSDEQVAIYLRSSAVSAAVKEALEKLVGMKAELAETTRQRTAQEKRVQEIAAEQERIRQNMARLSQTAQLYGRYVSILTAQEDELATIREKIQGLREREAAQTAAVEQYLLSLEVK